MAGLTEKDLYPAVHDYLVSLGYIVRSEVRGLDVTAIKGDRLVVLELKRVFSTDLLVQAVKRQQLADSVYVVLPYPRDGTGSRRWRDRVHLLKRLHLGLMVVAVRPPESKVEVLFDPAPWRPPRKTGQRRAVLAEIQGRSADLNQGGSVRQKLITSYRQQAVAIAYYLRELGPQSPGKLRALGTGAKTLAILSRNHYGWFARLRRGWYGLTLRGEQELESYREIFPRAPEEGTGPPGR